MTTDHIVKSFDEELSRLSDQISRMGGLAEVQIERSIEPLQRRNTEEATQIIEDDARIDALQIEIEELAIQMIARRQPLATDLRATVSGLKVAPHIERIGDYAKNIARRTIALNQKPPIKPMFTIPRMGRMAREHGEGCPRRLLQQRSSPRPARSGNAMPNSTTCMTACFVNC